jgi:NAD(P)-dependent dehydrogenase (short-subunit alcohol dehydrogenase family)
VLAEMLSEAARRQGARVALATPEAASGSPAGRAKGIHLFSPDRLNDAGGCDLLVEEVSKCLAGLDAVIATIATPPIHALDNLSLEDWELSASAPLKRAIWLARRVVWEFLATGEGGRLVFVAEPTLADAVSSGAPANEVVGAGLVSLARSIAKEVGRRGIACNVVLSESEGPREREALVPLVTTALFLASDDASFVNGEAITVRV